MNTKHQEILNITAEECAEVIQAVSKINRFGIDNFKPGKPKTNRQHLEEEIGDLLAMVDLLVESKLLNEESIELARVVKHNKLREWSKIYVN